MPQDLCYLCCVILTTSSDYFCIQLLSSRSYIQDAECTQSAKKITFKFNSD